MSQPAKRSPRTALLLLLGQLAALGLFGAGLTAALTYLPEWRDAGLVAPREALDRFRDWMRRAGLETAGEPHQRLAARAPEQGEPYRRLGDDGGRWLFATGTGVVVESQQAVRDPKHRFDGTLMMDLARGTEPQTVSWIPRDLLAAIVTFDGPTQARMAESLAPLLLRPGERLGREEQDALPGVPRIIFAVHGGSLPHHIYAIAGQTIFLGRRPGNLTAANVEQTDAAFSGVFNQFWAHIPVILAVFALFAGLIAQRRISIVNGLFLSCVALLTLNPQPTTNALSPAFGLVTELVLLAWIPILWSCAESLLRTTDPEFTTSLDALRTGRLGPRGGRALSIGLMLGAALAGLRLLVLSLSEAVPGIWPLRASLTLPIAQPMASPVANGILAAAWVALMLALAQRFLPLRWAPLGAAAGAAFFSPLIPLGGPLGTQTLASLAAAALLVFTLRRYGLTALLATSVVQLLLPAAAFAVLHREWMPVSAWLLPGTVLALAVVGRIGLSRSAAAEIARLASPGFVVRIEDDRRLKHEMDLLARMQRGLLPRSLPEIAGWEIAVRSIQAHEAGGDLYDFFEEPDGSLWIAAGDVAGHGYSCAIAQAMAKAALTSLIAPGRTPAEVLDRLDGVLRAGGADRNFTTLALLRLDPATGRGTVANAAHPYPLILRGEELEEIELPSLPLARGPARTYHEIDFELPPAAALVLFSDGLVEALDRSGEIYGFERLRAKLQKLHGRGAERIVQGLFGDWERHLRTVRPLDDTTVLVLRRLEARA